MVKSNIKKYMLFITILLLIFVFVGGILLGKTISETESKQISTFIKENELNTESYLIEQELIKSFDQNNCELASARIEDLSNELAGIGRKLTEENAKEKLGEENYNFLKRKYHLMQIKTYILFKKFIDACNTKTNIVLYYYSADDQFSAEQGKILDKVVQDYDIKVFAIEFNYSSELQFLEEYYNITATPTIIINYKQIYQGLTDYNKIEEVVSK